MQPEKKDAIRILLVSDRFDEICRSIIFLVDYYWENHGDGAALQSAYEKLKKHNHQHTNLFEWVVSHCSLWSLGLRKNRYKFSGSDSEVFKKASENWSSVREKALSTGEYGIFESYKEYPVHDVNVYKKIKLEAAYENKDKAKNIIDKAKKAIEKEKSASSATTATIAVIDAYIENPTSIYGANISSLYKYMKSSYDSPIHEQFYRVICNVTDWDIFRNKQDLTRSNNDNLWMKERQRLKRSRHGVADYHISVKKKGITNKESLNKTTKTSKQVIANLCEVEKILSTSFYSSMAQLNEYDFRRIKNKATEIIEVIKSIEEHRNLHSK